MILFRQSIGFRLLVLSFILLALPLLVDSFILVQRRYQYAINEAKAILLESAHLRELPFERLQPLDKPLLGVIMDYLLLDVNFPKEPSPALNEKLKRLSAIGSFFNILLIHVSADNKYIVVAASDPNSVGKDYTTFFRLYNIFTPSALERGFSDYVLLGQQTLHPFIIATDPIFSLNQSRYIGVLAISEDVSKKVETLLQPDTRRFQINFALLLPSSIIFAATDPALKFQYFLPLSAKFKRLFIEQYPHAASILAEQPISISNTLGYPFFEFTFNDQPQIGYIKKLQNANYSLLAYTSKTAIFEAPLLEFFNIYSIYGIILVVGGIATTLVIMQMAKPIQSLGLVMQKIQEGDLGVRYEKDPLGFEINTLGGIFNEMVNAVLKQKHRAEEERVKREIFEQEMQLGQQVQRSLLPHKMPDYPGVELAQTYIPSLEVGETFMMYLSNRKRQPPSLC